MTKRVPSWVLVGLIAATSCGGGDSSPTTPNPSANQPPTIGRISASPLLNESDTALMGATNVTFSVSDARDPDGDTLTYAWDFGDNVSGQGASPSHVYNSGGAFTARVTVNDGRGGSATGTFGVRVASLNGTWDGEIQPAPGSALRATRFTLVVTHSGGSLTGVWSDNGGATNRVAPGFLSHPFNVTFSCESCPSNASNDLGIRGTPVVSLLAPARPGFDVYNLVSGSCSIANTCSGFVMIRR